MITYFDNKALNWAAPAFAASIGTRFLTQNDGSGRRVRLLTAGQALAISYITVAALDILFFAEIDCVNYDMKPIHVLGGCMFISFFYFPYAAVTGYVTGFCADIVVEIASSCIRH